MIAFRNYDITEPKELFGREQDLQVLKNYAESLDQVELIGGRRFGKTCTLKCLVSLIKTNKNSNIIPIYTDLSSDSIKGTVNVYKYLISKTVSELFRINEFLEEEKIDNYVIKPNSDWSNIYKQLLPLNDVVDAISIFEKIVVYYAEALEKCFLFIFDEYEYLANKAFDTQDAFMAIRRISMQTLDCGINPISFWLAGASPWSKFIKDNNNSIGGSGEFNGVTNTKYLRPISKEAFHKMWDFECQKLESNLMKNVLQYCDKAFESSGGVPFYAKCIGSYLRANAKYPEYDLLQNQFVELEKIFYPQEIKLIRELSCSPKSYPVISSSLKKLLDYGIVCKDKTEKYIIPIKFYSDFCRAILFEHLVVTKQSTLQENQNKVITLMHDINEIWKRKEGSYLFSLGNAMTKQSNELHKPCSDDVNFGPFINSIYILYWDSCAIDNGPNHPKRHILPSNFQRSEFRKCMDTLRHYLGRAHNTENFNPLVPLDQALNTFYGSPYRPQSSSEWLHLQEQVLTLFVKELERLYAFVKAM